MLVQQLLPAFAAFGFAAAQSAVCTQATATVNNQADATALASCSTIKGSVYIGPNADNTITLDGPQQITGNLIVDGAKNLITLSSTTIGAIGGALNLTGAQVLNTLRFDALNSVGSLNLVALPALYMLTFPEVVSKAKSVNIDNTKLNTLDGINLASVDTLTVTNNARLKTFSTQIGNATKQLTVTNNGDDLDISFPNLIWANNLDIRVFKSLSIPSLAVINNSLSVRQSKTMETFSAPNLTSIGNFGAGTGSLTVAGNNELKNITLPLLTTIGGASNIKNNTALTTVSFPVLKTVGGAVDISAANLTLPNLPALTNVKGGFNVQSNEAIDCSDFKAEAGPGKVIEGKFTCAQIKGTVGDIASSPTATGSSAKPSNVASAFELSKVAAGLSLAGGLMQFL